MGTRTHDLLHGNGAQPFRSSRTSDQTACLYSLNQSQPSGRGAMWPFRQTPPHAASFTAPPGAIAFARACTDNDDTASCRPDRVQQARCMARPHPWAMGRQDRRLLESVVLGDRSDTL
jgi:hypothetical protein